MTRKIGLAVCYKVPNYGSVLQAFATQQKIKKMGFDSECVDYTKKIDLKTILLYLHTLFIPYVLKMKINTIRKKFANRKESSKHGANFSIRFSKINEFVNSKFETSKSIIGYNELRESSHKYAALLVGSDQIWHPLNLGSHFYTLEWGFEGQSRIAYAPSFGVSKIPWIQKNKTIKYLDKINFLSCREKNGVDIVKSLTGKNAELVVDPTLLFSADEWSDLLKNNDQLIKEPYIFCYFLGNNKSHRKYANELKAKTNLKIVFLPHIDEVIPADRNFGDYQLYDIGPAEFVSLVRDAQYVCTDSFHGTVFSILNKKKFTTFNRFDSGKASTNSRIDSLLSLLKLEERRFKEGCQIQQIDKEIDYSSVLTILEKCRNNSTIYLKNAIEESLKC